MVDAKSVENFHALAGYRVLGCLFRLKTRLRILENRPTERSHASRYRNRSLRWEQLYKVAQARPPLRRCERDLDQNWFENLRQHQVGVIFIFGKRVDRD